MKKFTDLDMADMREYFIQLLNDIPDERMKVTREKLVEYLDKKGFFEAPASTKYHSHVKGGLCYHSLRVYENLKSICQMKGLNYTIDQIAIVSLFHDISKQDFYSSYMKNVKVNNQWVQEEHMGVQDWNKRMLFGSHEENSLYLCLKLFNLNDEEAAAIVNHHGGYDRPQMYEITQIQYTYPLAAALFLADTMSTIFDEDMLDE